MSVELTKATISALTHEAFKPLLDRFSKSSNDKVTARVELTDLPLEALHELERHAKEKPDRGLARVLKVFLAARAGDFTHGIARLSQAADVLNRYLATDLIDGWIYVEDVNGHLNPQLVKAIGMATETFGQEKREYLAITTVAMSHSESRNDRYKVDADHEVHKFYSESVINKTAPDILASKGIHKETAELKADHEASMRRYVDEIMPSFAKQFRFTGRPVKTDSYSHKANPVVNRKVILDLEQSDYGPLVAYEKSSFIGNLSYDDGNEFHAEGTGLVPYNTVMRVFDLKTYEFYWVNARDVQEYVYDEKLARKLVLPNTHRDLLDVLTSDLESFTGDIIEGKSTGNVILCTGISGVGKTLTAEVYSETLKVPLYTIHSGNLGTTAEAIQKSLQVIFQRSKRWGCVLLLDEADVFVQQRGNSVENNAIVAEFLRTMEYFDGLLFMTTNRHDDIDDAILSRCLAIIRYHAPERDDGRAIWKIISTELGQPLDAALIDELVTSFPEACGRDMKNLCGTVFRMVKGGRWKLDADSFRRAAMFRGVNLLRNKGKGTVEGVEDAEIATIISDAQDRIEREMGFRPSPADAMKHLAKLAA